MPSATQLGWMDWPCPYKRISKFNNPTSETYEYDAPMEDILDVGSKPEAPGLKKHAACDECRTRKLKCSGGDCCTRCRKHNLACHFSVQKQMGRPRKRRREEENNALEVVSEKQPASNSPIVDTIPVPILPFDPLDNVGLNNFASYSPATPGPLTPLPLNLFETSHQSFEDPFLQPPNIFEQSQGTSSISDEPSLYNPTSNSPLPEIPSWPDFSTAVSSYPVHPTLSQQYPQQDLPNAQLPTPPPIPQCSCLPTLYLTLSSLQTHTPAFPGSMPALRNAASTALSVLRCTTCPLSFPSALQNVMLLGTLLPVILSTHQQLLQSVANPETIPPERRTITVGEAPSGLVEFDNLLIGVIGAEHPWGAAVEVSAEKWAELCRRAVRREMYGTLEDELPAPGQEKGGIMGLVNEMEARQHSWHERLANGDLRTHFEECRFGGIPGGIPHGIGHEKADEREKLCLRIVDNVRKIASSMGFNSQGKEEHWYNNLPANGSTGIHY